MLVNVNHALINEESIQQIQMIVSNVHLIFVFIMKEVFSNADNVHQIGNTAHIQITSPDVTQTMV